MVEIRVIKEILFKGKSFHGGQEVIIKIKPEYARKHKEKAVYKGEIGCINSEFFFLEEGNTSYPILPENIEYIELLSIY